MTSGLLAILRRVDGESVYVQAKSQLYTTTEIPDAEAYLVTTAKEAGGRVVDETTLGLALLEQAANGVTLNPGQVRLVSEMATSGARLQLALAPAGSGKTTAMSVLSKAWTDSGGQVVGLALRRRRERAQGRDRGPVRHRDPAHLLDPDPGWDAGLGRADRPAHVGGDR